MKPILAALAATGLVAAASAPAFAQDRMDDDDDRAMMNDRMMSSEERIMYDRLPADRRAAYDRFDQQTRDYYRTLRPEQTDMFFMLDDTQRSQMMALTPEQRDRAWTSMMQRQGNMAQGNMGQGNMAQGNMTQGNIRFTSNAVVQNAPAPHQGEYPICETDMQDNCMNAWEAGRRGAGVSRPLDYWPGRPASSM